MSSLLDILNTVNNALADDSGFDLSELDKAVAEMHLKLTEPEWAIEDEVLREECQKLVVQWAAQRYLDGVTDLELDKPLADTDVANPPSTPTSTDTKIETLSRVYFKDDDPYRQSFIKSFTDLLTSEKNKARIDEVERRKEANTKLARLLTELKKETTRSQGLDSGEIQVVLMAESKIRRHFQQVEQLRIKDRLAELREME